jgi:hypothetical protein
VGRLREALKKAFPDFAGDAIEATGVGYRLTIR